MLPPDGDVYLLVDILHNWDDANSTKILRCCAEAVISGERIVVAERIITDEADENVHAIVSGTGLYMLLFLGGRERTDFEFRRLDASGDLKYVRRNVLSDQPWLSLIEYVVKK